MNSFGLVKILPKLGILRIVLVHALRQTIYFSQRSAVRPHDDKNIKIFENFGTFAKITENE